MLSWFKTCWLNVRNAIHIYKFHDLHWCTLMYSGFCHPINNRQCHSKMSTPIVQHPWKKTFQMTLLFERKSPKINGDGCKFMFSKKKFKKCNMLSHIQDSTFKLSVLTQLIVEISACRHATCKWHCTFNWLTQNFEWYCKLIFIYFEKKMVVEVSPFN